MSFKIIEDDLKDANLFQMPGGEYHINSLGNLSHKPIIMIMGGTPDDMMAMCIWADAIHRDRGKPVLLIPYLPGARQDRRQIGEALSCKVYADMINSCNFERVVCVDPHSDVMPALINNLVIVPLVEVVKNVLYRGTGNNTYDGIIIPDAGAIKRAEAISRYLKVPAYQASKHRDMDTGKLSHFSCERLPPDGTYLVVDDICDGGGTFMGLATATGLPPAQLHLWVTHGIFSGDNSKNLVKYYSKILTTNSHQGCITPEYHQPFKDAMSRYDITNIMLEYVS